MLNEAAQDAIFLALSHAARRRILDLLKTMPGATINDVCKYFDVSSRKVGRTRQLYLNAVPLQAVHDRWSTEYGQFWAGRVMDLKYQLEGLTKASSNLPAKPQ